MNPIFLLPEIKTIEFIENAKIQIHFFVSNSFFVHHVEKQQRGKHEGLTLFCFFRFAPTEINEIETFSRPSSQAKCL